MRSHVLLAAGFIATAYAAPSPKLSDLVEQEITTEKLQKTLSGLYAVAVANNNTRQWGTPGYLDSVHYITNRTAAHGPKINTTVQSFTGLWFHLRSISLTEGGKPVRVLTPQFNNPTPDAGITGAVQPLPDDLVRGSGCDEADFAALEAAGKGVKGKFALMKRGTCGFIVKATLATKYGAIGILFYNNAPGTSYISPSIFGGLGKVVPAGTVTLETGQDYIARTARGEVVTVTLRVDSESGIKESWNVIAETTAGDAEKVIVLGAHLDSVQRGPGMNDDGSGSAALVEVMDALIKSAGEGVIRNKVRFIWWGAEEAGLVGSDYYTQHLTEGEAEKIKFYFNYDMIGSIHPIYVVGKSNITGTVPEIIGDFIKKQGKEVEYGPFDDGGSDYDGFNVLGIPVSGGFTGDDAETDPCYHQECDTLDNISWEALTIFSKAAGRAAATLAQSLCRLDPKIKARGIAPKHDGLSSGQRWAAQDL